MTRPHWLLHLAGFSVRANSMQEHCAAASLMYCALSPREWLAMCYRQVRGPGPFAQRSFCGKPVGADQLNLSRPRACPACLRERPVWWAIWDLGLWPPALSIAAFSSTSAPLARRCWLGSVQPLRGVAAGLICGT